MTDLSTYTLDELRSLATQVTDQLRIREEQQKGAAREQILAIAKSVGLPLKELLGELPEMAYRPKGKPAAIRFRNPNNMAEFWSGRGRQPKWVRDWVGTGKPREGLRAS